MSFSLDAAREAGVPCALFWTASACGYMGYRHFQFLIDEGLAPLKDEEQLRNGCLDTPVGWARGMSKHMRLRDFPTFIYTMRRGDVLLDFMMREVARTDAVILNTFHELETAALDAMRATLPPPVYTIGPLSLLLERLAAAAADLSTIRASLWKEDLTVTSLLESLPHRLFLSVRWLDGWPTRSVVYVNYGCITTMSNEELVEFAWGLPGRGYDFLWIIRPDLVKGETAVLPPEFVEATMPPSELVRAGGGGGVPDARRVELDDGEPLRGGVGAVLALLRGAADQLPVRVRRVGRGDGGRRRRAAGGAGGQDQEGDGRREGEGDEAEGGGVEGRRRPGDAARRQGADQPGRSDP
ncbi:hypothetical protein SEVIR_1G211950v4 [Setaria viridis]|uniref:Uncharacterized protein n=1 Tax=Setaria viridis TaxID=4556 RepID=A0A4U6WDT6_SETVI|nr:hypothetical protein SEVIR_1G211950v2 [Setaria viridis]